MQAISPYEFHYTSLTLRVHSKRRLKAALEVLRRNGVIWSESELLRRLAKMYLGFWRGRGKKSATAKRYNTSIEGQKYVRISWYIDRVLHAILVQRSVHSGESVSRMLDFAIRHYTPRLIEDILRMPMPRHEFAARNATFWRRRWGQRPNPQPDLFITYQCETRKNDSCGLQYEQTYIIHPKTGLSPIEILDLMQRAA